MADSTEQVASAYFRCLASRDASGMADLWEPGGIDRFPGLTELQAPHEIRTWFADLFSAFPDFGAEVLDMVVDGQSAAVRWRATGTFDGNRPFVGLNPNGSSLDIEGFDLLTVTDGRIVSNHAYLNGADLARQLGALPPADSLPDRAMLGALNLVTKARDRLAERTR
ncbi:hypothetical protein BH20ACT15_BH20ACT15_02810 [soil metagenome]